MSTDFMDTYNSAQNCQSTTWVVLISHGSHVYILVLLSFCSSFCQKTGWVGTVTLPTTVLPSTLESRKKERKCWGNYSKTLFFMMQTFILRNKKKVEKVAPNVADSRTCAHGESREDFSLALFPTVLYTFSQVISVGVEMQIKRLNKL